MTFWDQTKPVKRWLSEYPKPQPRPVGPNFWKKWDWLIGGAFVIGVCSFLSWVMNR